MRSAAKRLKLTNRRDVFRFSVGETVRVPVRGLLPEWDMEPVRGRGTMTVTAVDYRRGVVTIDARGF